MKRTMAMVFGVAAIFSALTTAAIMAADVSENMNYRGEVNFDEGAIVKIKGVQVTATAAQLNAAGGGSGSTLTPTLVSNATLKVYGSNLVIKAGGTITTPSLDVDGSVDFNMLATGDEIVIAQTNVAGTATVPLIAITDARTGATANTPAEATLVLTPSGTHALSVAAGKVNVAGLTASQLVLTDSSKDLSSSATVPADSVNKAAMSAVDYGDFTADADGNCTLDADVVAAAEMADADHGDVSWSSGVATVDNVAAANISGNIAIARMTNALIDAIGADQMANADHGDVSWASGVATVDAVGGTAAATIASGAAAGATAVQPATTPSLTGVTLSGPITIISGGYTGVLNIVSTTLTMVVNGSVTNVLDADITTP